MFRVASVIDAQMQARRTPVALLLIAALVGLLLSGHSAAGAATLPQPPPSNSYTYPSPLASTGDAYTHYDRGPPTARVDIHRRHADDPRSRGALARAASVIAAANYTYDATVQFVSTARGERVLGVEAAATTQGQVQAMVGAISSRAPTFVAAKTTTGLVGKKYGLGTVVENPGLTIQGFRGAKNPSLGLNQIINRGVSPSTLRNTVANPKVVLEQGSGNFVHIADDAVVVLRPDGKLVTTYGRSDSKQHIFDILGDVG